MCGLTPRLDPWWHSPRGRYRYMPKSVPPNDTWPSGQYRYTTLTKYSVLEHLRPGPFIPCVCVCASRVAPSSETRGSMTSSNSTKNKCGSIHRRENQISTKSWPRAHHWPAGREIPPPPLAARAGTRDWPDREETQSLGRHRRGGERSRSRDRPWVAILGWGSGGGCGLWWARAGGALFFPCGSCVVGAAMILQPW